MFPYIPSRQSEEAEDLLIKNSVISDRVSVSIDWTLDEAKQYTNEYIESLKTDNSRLFSNKQDIYKVLSFINFDYWLNKFNFDENWINNNPNKPFPTVETFMLYWSDMKSSSHTPQRYIGNKDPTRKAVRERVRARAKVRAKRQRHVKSRLQAPPPPQSESRMLLMTGVDTIDTNQSIKSNMNDSSKFSNKIETTNGKGRYYYFDKTTSYYYSPHTAFIFAYNFAFLKGTKFLWHVRDPVSRIWSIQQHWHDYSHKFVAGHNGAYYDVQAYQEDKQRRKERISNGHRVRMEQQHAREHNPKIVQLSHVGKPQRRVLQFMNRGDFNNSSIENCNKSGKCENNSEMSEISEISENFEHSDNGRRKRRRRRKLRHVVMNRDTKQALYAQNYLVDFYNKREHIWLRFLLKMTQIEDENILSNRDMSYIYTYWFYATFSRYAPAEHYNSLYCYQLSMWLNYFDKYFGKDNTRNYFRIWQYEWITTDISKASNLVYCWMKYDIDNWDQCEKHLKLKNEFENVKSIQTAAQHIWTHNMHDNHKVFWQGLYRACNARVDRIVQHRPQLVLGEWVSWNDNTKF